MGARHVDSPVDGIVVDKTNRIVTTPAYMLGPTISSVATGIGKLVDEVLKLTR
jgi:enhancing lycopene biosynthesis protein 2